MEGFRHRSSRRPEHELGVGAARSRRVAQPPTVGSDLHICPRCSSPLVQPAEWAPVDHLRWRVTLACPECEWNGGGVYRQQDLDRYDAILDDGATALARSLQELAHANMEEDVNRFCDALAADLIEPDDF